MKRSFFVLAALISSSQLIAQQDTLLLDPVVFTANKIEQKQSQTGKVITIITKQTLEKSQGKSLAQVLNEQAGVTIAGAYNTTGSVQTVFVRGASAGRTLILIDGIPVNDPSMINNEFDLNLFSINDIERIEICKGAQSTLYGSDAIGGVVNIITVKKDIKKPINIRATTTFGNRNTSRNNIQLYGKADKLIYTTRFARLNTSGFSSANDDTGNGNFDRDGYDGNSLNAGFQYQAASSLLLKYFLQNSWYKADIDAGIFSDDRDYTINNSGLTTGGGFHYQKGIINVTGNYQYGKLKRNYHNDSLHAPGFSKFESNRYNGKTNYVELFTNIKATNWLTILAGFDHRKGSMNQDYLSISSFGPYSSSFENKSLSQSSFYASAILSSTNKKLNIELGGRTNNHSRYGNNGTYTFNPSYTINSHFRVLGSIASGFKAPSVYQVFDEFSGNEELKPEKSTNIEMGVQQTHAKFSSRLVYFHRDIKNGIDYNYVTFQYFNFIKQTVNGVEAELHIKPVPGLNLSANYTYINGKEQTQSRKSFGDTTYSHLLRRPRHHINFTVGYQFCPSFFASVSGKSVSARYDVGGYQQEDVLMSSYFILNAYAEYVVTSNIRFFADLQNITDNPFFDIRGYNAIPFLINGGITFNW